MGDGPLSVLPAPLPPSTPTLILETLVMAAATAAALQSPSPLLLILLFGLSSSINRPFLSPASANANLILDPSLITKSDVNSNPNLISSADVNSNPNVIITANPNLIPDPYPSLISNPNLVSVPNPDVISKPKFVSIMNPSAISNHAVFPSRNLISNGGSNGDPCASECGALKDIRFPFGMLSGCSAPGFNLDCGNNMSESPVWAGLIPNCDFRVKQLTFFPHRGNATVPTMSGSVLLSLPLSKGWKVACAEAMNAWLTKRYTRWFPFTLGDDNTESALCSFAQHNCSNFTTVANYRTDGANTTVQLDSLLLNWTVNANVANLTTNCQMCHSPSCKIQLGGCGVTCRDGNATTHCLCMLNDGNLTNSCSEPTKTLPVKIPPPQSNNGAGNNRQIVTVAVVSVVGLVLALLVIGGLLICVQRRRARNRASRALFPGHNSVTQLIQSLAKQVGPQPIKLFTFQELLEATDSFSKSTVLADGGFSTVYECTLADGRKAAVKRLHPNSYKKVGQFVNEIRLLSGLNHPNLICLQGFCYEDGQDPLLVYEFVSNGTLADHLHRCSGRKPLPWGTRLDMALEVSQALAYLHFCASPTIIHRDVKSTNILVDEDFHVRLADFGLSRLVPIESSHVVTEPQGTPGYLDPDYHRCYQLTDKSDVYSFGVVLMELISAKIPVDMSRGRPEINLASLALAKIQSGALEELVDPYLDITLDPLVRQMVTGVAELGFRCLASEKDDRPCMKEVVKELARIKQMATKTGLEPLQLQESESTKRKSPSAKKCTLSSSPSAHSVCWSSLESHDWESSYSK